MRWPTVSYRQIFPSSPIEIPLQRGFYFGAENYRAGWLAGQVLSKFAAANWKGQYDAVVLMESSLASTIVSARLGGVLVGLRDTLGSVNKSSVKHLDGRYHFESSRKAMASFLARSRKGERLLIGCVNDLAALGALQAVRAVGREKDVAIVGQNATESREELRNPHSRFVASIAYFPERYGEKLIRLARSILNHEAVERAVYTQHLVVDCHNVRRLYGQE